ncbi:hypothetical protein Fmac_016231 [Flemingia macrophylla]|uniref:Uncharacterized protein n=1 Tax=Flemingia macrophylla TaxID=520843 RepID=A0ABD1MGV5_9FABA
MGDGTLVDSRASIQLLSIRTLQLVEEFGTIVWDQELPTWVSPLPSLISKLQGPSSQLWMPISEDFEMIDPNNGRNGCRRKVKLENCPEWMGDVAIEPYQTLYLAFHCSIPD